MQDSNQSNMERGMLQMLDTAYETNLPQQFLNRKKWERPNPNQVKSFIPGTVLQILVKKGQKVKKGDRLAIFVAMKMNNVILAHQSGTVADILVNEGDRLPKGVVMFEVNP